METTIDLRDLLKRIKRNWIVLLVFALLVSVTLNILGVRRAEKQQDISSEAHEKFVQEAANLPEYFTEEMYNLRKDLSTNDAEFCEAYAQIYRDYISEFRKGTLTEDSARLESYMMFMDSYKDVLSVLSGTQRAYFNSLISIDSEKTGTGAPVEGYTVGSVSKLQVKWILIGAILGGIIGAAIVALPYLLTDKLRTSLDMEAVFGIPVLSSVKKSETPTYQTDFVATGISMMLKNHGSDSVALVTSGFAASEELVKCMGPKLKEYGIRYVEVNALSDSASDLEIISSSRYAVLLEETGKSRYSDIQNEIRRCAQYDTVILGCLVTE